MRGFDVINPATEQVVATVDELDESGTDEAVAPIKAGGDVMETGSAGRSGPVAPPFAEK